MSSGATTAIKPDLSQVSQAEHIRNTMSVKNLLAPLSPTTAEAVDGLVNATDLLKRDEFIELMDIDVVGKTDEPTKTAETTEANEPVAPIEPTAPTTIKTIKEEDVTSPLSALPASGVVDSLPDADTVPDDVPEDVPDSEREFICMNDEYSRCKTGQYTMGLARKVISDHFGRNKGCTLKISSWPLFCRKHYQRATYNKEKWQYKKVYLIDRQLGIIEGDYPGTTYLIQFKKSEENRLNQYARLVSSGMVSDQAAQVVQPNSSKHFEAPIDVLRELDQYLGKNKSMQEAKNIVDIIHQMLEANETDQVPSIEFLPQLPGENTTSRKTPVKIRTTKSPKTAKSSSKTPKDKTPSSHVSAKGAVKKTQKA